VITVSEIIAALTALPPDDMPKIVAAAAAHWAEVQPATEPPSGGNTDDESLTIEEAAKLLRHSTKWVYRNKKRLTFIHKVGPRSYLVSKNGLLRWRDRQHV
jgi:Helix-turn-helix domain